MALLQTQSSTDWVFKVPLSRQAWDRVLVLRTETIKTDTSGPFVLFCRGATCLNLVLTLVKMPMKLFVAQTVCGRVLLQ